MFKPKVINRQKFGDEFIDEIEIHGSVLLNRNCMLYGASGQGKTEFLKDLMARIHDDGLIPVWFAFTTSPETFDGRLPPSYIFTKYDGLKLREIFTKAEANSKIYNRCSDINVIKSLYDMNPDVRVNELVKKLNEGRETRLIELKKISKSEDEAKSHEEDLKLETEEKEIHIMKKYISSCQKFYNNCKSLDEDQKFTLEYIDFNPHMGIIFDDFAALIQGIPKKEKKILSEIYFQGRHKKLTTFMTVQADTSMDKAFRENAHINVYADPGSASTCFSAARGLPQQLRIKANKLIREGSTFYKRETGEGKGKIYRMLMVFRMFGDYLCFASSRKVPKIEYGSQSYWKLNNSVINDNSEKDKDNQYLRKLTSRV